jgi:hypothetical protein
MIWKYTLAWIPMIFIAIMNGSIRQFIYSRWVTELTAHQISCATGIILFFIYAFGIAYRLPLTTSRQAWLVGAIWLLLTVAFEFGFGLFIAGHPLDRLLHDYNIAAGRLWLLVLISLFLMPFVIFQIRQRKNTPAHVDISRKTP